MKATRRARFEQLFDEHYRAVLAYALRRAAPDQADDAVAETFLVAWRRLEDVPAQSRPWLYGIARRVLANQRRAAVRRQALAARVAAEPSTPGAVVAGEAPVVRALARLSDLDREVLMLFAWEGLSREEAACALGCSRTAVSVRLHRARRRLRAELEQPHRAASSPKNDLNLEDA